MREVVGTLGAIWRYPVKSMAGEPLRSAGLTVDKGLLGDRAYALIDEETGKRATPAVGHVDHLIADHRHVLMPFLKRRLLQPQHRRKGPVAPRESSRHRP